MALIWADRVLETSTTTGTGSFALAGAVDRFRAFDDVCANGDTVYYAIEGASGTGEWECGLGTFNDTDTLVRTTVHASSNGGSAVSFSAGTKRVMLSLNAVWATRRTSWRLQWFPKDNEPPASNYATLDTRNSHPVLDFDTTTQETAIFRGFLPADYASRGVTITLVVAATSATSGTIGFDVAFERIDASGLDIDADSFASATTVTATTVPGTSGQVLYLTVNVSDGANMDSLAAGEMFRLRIRRDVSNDTATGDAELLGVSMVEQ